MILPAHIDVYLFNFNAAKLIAFHATVNVQYTMDSNTKERQRIVMINNLKECFGFTDEMIKEFFGILGKTRAYLAGGFCLAAFLEKPLLKGQDLDIWLPSPAKAEVKNGRIDTSTYVYPSAKVRYMYEDLAEELFTQFLKRMGYKGAEMWDAYYSTLQYRVDDNRFTQTVRRITNYVRESSDHKIQLITTYDIPWMENVRTFDLNVCQFSIHANMNLLYNSHESHLNEIRSGRMRINPKGVPLTEKRRAKYESRGFRFIDEPTGETKPTSWF